MGCGLVMGTNSNRRQNPRLLPSIPRTPNNSSKLSPTTALQIRKLEFILAHALESGCDTVLTCGGLQSNHCRATAVAAREVRLSLVVNVPA